MVDLQARIEKVIYCVDGMHTDYVDNNTGDAIQWLRHVSLAYGRYKHEIQLNRYVAMVHSYELNELLKCVSVMHDEFLSSKYQYGDVMRWLSEISHFYSKYQEVEDEI